MNFISGLMYVVVVVTVVKSCSVPEGGFKPPTPAEIVKYASHVVLGEVTEIIPDPLYGDMYGNSTYGAMVTVQCFYKGSVLPGRIQIGGAGFVPGMCTAKDLEVGTHYLLFLHEKRDTDEAYEQSETAELKSKVANFLSVCGLSMDYPRENGITLKRKVCLEATAKPDCPTTPVPGSDVTPVVGTNEPGTPPPNIRGTASENTGSGDGNSGSMTSASFVSIITFLMCSVCLM